MKKTNDTLIIAALILGLSACRSTVLEVEESGSCAYWTETNIGKVYKDSSGAHVIINGVSRFEFAAFYPNELKEQLKSYENFYTELKKINSEIDTKKGFLGNLGNNVDEKEQQTPDIENPSLIHGVKKFNELESTIHENLTNELCKLKNQTRSGVFSEVGVSDPVVEKGGSISALGKMIYTETGKHRWRDEAVTPFEIISFIINFIGDILSQITGPLSSKTPDDNVCSEDDKKRVRFEVRAATLLAKAGETNASTYNAVYSNMLASPSRGKIVPYCDYLRDLKKFALYYDFYVRSKDLVTVAHKVTVYSRYREKLVAAGSKNSAQLQGTSNLIEGDENLIIKDAPNVNGAMASLEEMKAVLNHIESELKDINLVVAKCKEKKVTYYPWYKGLTGDDWVNRYNNDQFKRNLNIHKESCTYEEIFGTPLFEPIPGGLSSLTSLPRIHRQNAKHATHFTDVKSLGIKLGQDEKECKEKLEKIKPIPVANQASSPYNLFNTPRTRNNNQSNLNNSQLQNAFTDPTRSSQQAAMNRNSSKEAMADLSNARNEGEASSQERNKNSGKMSFFGNRDNKPKTGNQGLASGVHSSTSNKNSGDAGVIQRIGGALHKLILGEESSSEYQKNTQTLQNNGKSNQPSSEYTLTNKAGSLQFGAGGYSDDVSGDATGGLSETEIGARSGSASNLAAGVQNTEGRLSGKNGSTEGSILNEKCEIQTGNQSCEQLKRKLIHDSNAEDYFLRIGINESIFEKVRKRYQLKEGEFESE